MVSQTEIVVATQIEQLPITDGYPGSRTMIKGSDLAKKMTPPNGFQASLYKCLYC